MWVLSCFSHVQLFATPCFASHQAPLPMEFSRQEYWRGLPFPSPGDLPSPGLEPRSPELQADSLPTELLGKPWKRLNTPRILSGVDIFDKQGLRQWAKTTTTKRTLPSNRVSVKTFTLWVPFGVHFLHFYVADSFTVLFFQYLEEWVLCSRPQPQNT